MPRSAMRSTCAMTMPPRVARRHGDGQRLQRQRLALHGDVAVGVGGGAADDADVDREGLVEQVLLAVDRHQRDQVLGGARVELAAAVARIDEGAQADAAEVPGLAGGDVAEQVRDHALRQVVGLDLVVHRQLLQLRHQAPVAADDALDQALVAEVVEAALLAVALAGGVDQRQVARRPRRRRRQEALLQRHGDVLGEADADEAAGGDGVAVADQRHRLGGADDLALAAGRSLAMRSSRFAGWFMLFPALRLRCAHRDRQKDSRLGQGDARCPWYLPPLSL